jgi:hypothetical protein
MLGWTIQNPLKIQLNLMLFGNELKMITFYLFLFPIYCLNPLLINDYRDNQKNYLLLR